MFVLIIFVLLRGNFFAAEDFFSNLLRKASFAFKSIYLLIKCYSDTQHQPKKSGKTTLKGEKTKDAQKSDFCENK